MKTEPNSRPFWEVQNRLSYSDDLVWLDNRIFIPKSYQSQILNLLHSAHQGVTSMTKRANQTVYWPGITNSIRNMWYNCQRCKNIPSQLKEPLIISKTAEYPFQYIFADYFKIKGNHYLAVVDRFSSWVMIDHFLPTKLNHQSLIDTCKEIFTTYGTPEEISTMVVHNSLHTSSKSFCTNGVCNTDYH